MTFHRESRYFFRRPPFGLREPFDDFEGPPTATTAPSRISLLCSANLFPSRYTIRSLTCNADNVVRISTINRTASRIVNMHLFVSDDRK